MGAIEVQAIISDMARAAWSFSARSRTIVRASTTPPQAASPCRNRSTDQMAGLEREGAADAGHDVDGEADQDDRPATEAIAGRAIEDLADAEGDHEGRERELDVARGALQIDGDHRQRRQVHVDRQRRERRQQGKQDQQDRRQGRAESWSWSSGWL